jgi:hypothetical protein
MSSKENYHNTHSTAYNDAREAVARNDRLPSLGATTTTNKKFKIANFEVGTSLGHGQVRAACFTLLLLCLRARLLRLESTNCLFPLLTVLTFGGWCAQARRSVVWQCVRRQRKGFQVHRCTQSKNVALTVFAFLNSEI